MERCAGALAARLGRTLTFDDPVAPPREEEIPYDAPVRAAVDLVGELVPA